jgi:nicotinamidase-related amidase
MSWKTAYRSFYYEGAPEPEDLVLEKSETALLVIDIQNTYLQPSDDPDQRKKWAPFLKRMNSQVIPRTAEMITFFRKQKMEVLFARIACLKENGKDRSLSQKKPGWNYLLLPKDSEESQIVPELSPEKDEIVVCKTTDSALTGTNLRLLLHNMGIKNVVIAGIFTDQCISSSVRSLADESFNVVVLEDCCAAGSKDLHDKELEILNMIYCHVVFSEELLTFIK